jgi:hypothetical protein
MADLSFLHDLILFCNLVFLVFLIFLIFLIPLLDNKLLHMVMPPSL